MKNIDGKKIIEVLIKLYAEQNNVEAVIENEKKPTENSGLKKNN